MADRILTQFSDFARTPVIGWVTVLALMVGVVYLTLAVMERIGLWLKRRRIQIEMDAAVESYMKRERATERPRTDRRAS